MADCGIFYTTVMLRLQIPTVMVRHIVPELGVVTAPICVKHGEDSHLSAVQLSDFFVSAVTGSFQRGTEKCVE